MANPYLQQQADAITQQVNQGFLQNTLPQINMGSIATGGFGGSRQAITQGLAAGNAATGLAGSLSNLYGNAYAQDQQLAAQREFQANQLAAQERMAAMSDATNRLGLQNQFTLGQGNLDLGRTQAQNQFTLGQGNLALGQTQAQNQYNLGLGNLGLGQYQAQTQRDLGFGNLGLGQMQANQNFYTSQRGQDLQALGLGSNLYGQATQGLLGQGQGLYNIGQTQQQAPWQALQNYASLLQPFSGLGQTQTQSTPGGSTLGGALGGALTAAQLWKLLGG